jgi:hypothetical protein
VRKAELIRSNTASITDMVSAAIFPVSLAASVTRDLSLSEIKSAHTVRKC